MGGEGLHQLYMIRTDIRAIGFDIKNFRSWNGAGMEQRIS